MTEFQKKITIGKEKFTLVGIYFIHETAMRVADFIGDANHYRVIMKVTINPRSGMHTRSWGVYKGRRR